MENNKNLLNEKTYSTLEVANMLHVTRPTITNYIKANKIKAIKISERKFLITENSLNNFLAKIK